MLERLRPWLWMKGLCLLLIKTLIIAPPTVEALPKLAVNSPCPACGHSPSSLLCIHDQTGFPYVERLCLTCGARIYLKPVVHAAGNVIQPASPEFTSIHRMQAQLPTKLDHSGLFRMPPRNAGDRNDYIV